jgi:hypothetical protein
VPIIAFFMAPSPKARFFMKTIRKKLITITVKPFYGTIARGSGLR